jgi:hypothetical protein
MEQSGFTPLATNLALSGLLQKKLIRSAQEKDYSDTYTIYYLTDSGFQWLIQNQSRFVLTIDDNEPPYEAP